MIFNVGSSNGSGLSGKVLTGTLTAGQTNLYFEDEAITSDCLIDIYVNHADAMPTDIYDEVGFIQLTFERQVADLSVKLVVNQEV